MEHVFLNGQVRLINADCLTAMQSLPESSVDLIATDPPYYRVKRNAWDNQWSSVEEYLAWLDAVLAEFWRVLKPSGSLYLFCGHKLSADTELMMRQRFNVLSHIIWAKPQGPWRRMKKETLRSYFPATERILFAEHYGAEGTAKGSSGYAQACAELKRQVFAPLIEYFKSARDTLGISAGEINAATGSKMCSHWFSYSQWQLPNEEQYRKLQALFQSKALALTREHNELTAEYAELGQTYQALLREYDDLKREYELLRRPFAVTKEVPHTDVWTFEPVQHYPGKHPCEKPADLMEHIIRTSSREGQVVLDTFMGSGSTGKQAVKLGRKFIGMELEEGTFGVTMNQFKELTQPA